MNLINEKELKDRFTYGQEYTYADIMAKIETSRVIDAEEVVYCENCDKATQNDQGDWFCTRKGWERERVDAKHFCKHGERWNG